MVKFSGLYRIIRPANFLIIFATMVVAGVFCTPEDQAYLWDKILTAALAGGLTAAAGNIINDYFDIEIDKINRPGRVLPSGTLSPMEAMTYYLLFSILAVFTSSFINDYCVYIVIYTLAGMYFYSAKLKGIPLLGNLVIAHYTGLAFIFGGVAAGDWQFGMIPGIFAFMINLVREILKDIEDIEGDSAAGIITYPMKNGIKKTRSLIFSLTLLLIVMTFIPYRYEIYKIEYFITVMSSVNLILVWFLKKLFTGTEKKSLREMSNLLKIAMVFGLAAVFLGK